MTQRRDIGPDTQRPLDPGRGIAALVCVVSVLTPPLLAVERQRARSRPATSDAARTRASVQARHRHPAAFLITTVIAGASVPEVPELAVPVPQPVSLDHRAGLEAPTISLALAGRHRTLRSSAPPQYRLAPKGSPPV